MRHWISIEVGDLGEVLDRISDFLEDVAEKTVGTKMGNIVGGLKKSIINLVQAPFTHVTLSIHISLSKRKTHHTISWRIHPSPAFPRTLMAFLTF